MIGKLAVWAGKSALMMSPAGGIIRGAGALFGKVPWQIWAALALAIAVFVGVKVHGHKVDAFGNERFTAGYAKGYADAKADLEKAKAEVETKGVAMAQDERKKNDAKTADLDRSVADFMRGGPGRAACSPVAPATTDGATGPGGAKADDTVSPVPAEERQPLIGVPVDAAAAFARQNDKALIDNASWWSWYDRYQAILADYQRKVDEFNAKQGRKK